MEVPSIFIHFSRNFPYPICGNLHLLSLEEVIWKSFIFFITCIFHHQDPLPVLHSISPLRPATFFAPSDGQHGGEQTHGRTSSGQGHGHQLGRSIRVFLLVSLKKTRVPQWCKGKWENIFRKRFFWWTMIVWDMINGNSRILEWRCLPCIRPMFQG